MTKNKKPFYSVVVPVYNEEDNVKDLHKEILQTMDKLDKPYEIIFVDDGSYDKTFKQLKELKPIKIIQLRRNRGQSAALDAGIKNSKGEIIITLDGDQQNDPKDIPKLLKTLKNKEYDFVCGWRYERKDPWIRSFISEGARILRKPLVSDRIHDSGCTLRVYKKECFEDVNLHGELHRMLPAMLRWKGFKIGEKKVNHRARKHGKTHYDWKRIVKGFLDMLGVWFWRKYHSRPLHLFGTLGLLFIFSSTFLGIYLAIQKLFYNYTLSNKIWPLIATTGFITGIQFLIFGLLADLIIKNRPDQKFYQIKKIIEKA
jgi:glycosyltransferase involved in cell wall biosynthesis